MVSLASLICIAGSQSDLLPLLETHLLSVTSEWLSLRRRRVTKRRPPGRRCDAVGGCRSFAKLSGVKGLIGHGESRRMGLPEKKLEQWLVSIQTSHNLWCDCKDYRSHIPGWHTTTGDDGSLTASDVAFGAAVDFTISEPTDDADTTGDGR
ncbi:ORF2 [Torque teno arctocephalus australis virus]|nr:ORF2 [Torque teno arctocephalus australis virus]